jgi:hypothetical protein
MALVTGFHSIQSTAAGAVRQGTCCLGRNQIPPCPVWLRSGALSESQTLNCFLAVGLYAHQGEMASLVLWFD